MQEDCKIYDQMLECTGYDQTALSKFVIGDSGTLDNLHQLDIRFQDANCQFTDSNVYAKVEEKWGKDIETKKSTFVCIELTLINPIESLFQELNIEKRSYCAFMDVAATTKYMKGIDVVKAIHEKLKKGTKAKEGYAFKNGDHWSVYIPKYNKTVDCKSQSEADIFAASGVSRENLFVYFDQASCTGIDFKLPLTGDGILTGSWQKTQERDIVQGVKRMRQFETSQKCDLVIVDQPKGKSFEEFKAQTRQNTKSALELRELSTYTEQLKTTALNCLQESIGRCFNKRGKVKLFHTNRLNTLREVYSDIANSNIQFNPTMLYGSLKTEKCMKEVVQGKYNSILQKLHQFHCLKVYQTFQTSISNSRLLAIAKEKLGDQKTAQIDGIGVALGKEIAVQAQVEQQAEAEAQVQIQLQQANSGMEADETYLHDIISTVPDLKDPSFAKMFLKIALKMQGGIGDKLALAATLVPIDKKVEEIGNLEDSLILTKFKEITKGDPQGAGAAKSSLDRQIEAIFQSQILPSKPMPSDIVNKELFNTLKEQYIAGGTLERFSENFQTLQQSLTQLELKDYSGVCYEIELFSGKIKKVLMGENNSESLMCETLGLAKQVNGLLPANKVDAYTDRMSLNDFKACFEANQQEDALGKLASIYNTRLDKYDDILITIENGQTNAIKAIIDNINIELSTRMSSEIEEAIRKDLMNKVWTDDNAGAIAQAYITFLKNIIGSETAQTLVTKFMALDFMCDQDITTKLMARQLKIEDNKTDFNAIVAKCLDNISEKPQQEQQDIKSILKSILEQIFEQQSCDTLQTMFSLILDNIDTLENRLGLARVIASSAVEAATKDEAIDISKAKKYAANFDNNLSFLKDIDKVLRAGIADELEKLKADVDFCIINQVSKSLHETNFVYGSKPTNAKEKQNKPTEFNKNFFSLDKWIVNARINLHSEDRYEIRSFGEEWRVSDGMRLAFKSSDYNQYHAVNDPLISRSMSAGYVLVYLDANSQMKKCLISNTEKDSLKKLIDEGSLRNAAVVDNIGNILSTFPINKSGATNDFNNQTLVQESTRFDAIVKAQIGDIKEKTNLFNNKQLLAGEK